MCPFTVRYLEAEGMERTFKFTQQQIVESVDLQTASKVGVRVSSDFGRGSI